MKRRFLYILPLIFMTGFCAGHFLTFDKINSIFSNLHPVKFAEQLFNGVKPLTATVVPDFPSSGQEKEELSPINEELTEKEEELEGG